VLRHSACQKDAFVWSNFSSDKTKDNECGCWQTPASVQCHWETQNGADRFRFYYQILPRQELLEAGRDICWTDCAPYSRTGGVDVETAGGCSSCITVMDVHLIHPSLARLAPGDGVAKVVLARACDFSDDPVSCFAYIRPVV
jgi:hypothetical protein